MKKAPIIITIGGSLIVPHEINISFLKELRIIVSRLLNKGERLALVIGGGWTARKYQEAGRAFSHLTNEDLDWIGIKSICLNAELVFRIFSDMSVYHSVVENFEDFSDDGSELFIVGAEKPGYSSDTDAVLLAEKFSSFEIINFSNVSYVYSEDPRKNPNAKKFKKLSWNEYQNLIPKKWTPGLSAPFDPIASKLAKKYGIKVVILGASLKNLEAYLDGRNFEGTIIE